MSGVDPVTERPGFSAMLKELVADGVKTIIVESPDRFARDLAVQLAGHDYLRGLGLELVPASAPDFFVEDTPTAILVRQVLGAISQFEKTTLVAKLRAARDRKRQVTGKCEGRPSYTQTHTALVAEVRDLRRRGQTLQSIADVLAERGHLNRKGHPFAPTQIARMAS